MYIVPVTAAPNQSFICTIPVDGKSITLNFFLRYNTMANYWIMELYDAYMNPIILSIPLLCGSNLLEQYSYLMIGSCAIYKVDATLAEDNPTDTDLGTNFQLIWSDTALQNS